MDPTIPQTPTPNNQPPTSTPPTPPVPAPVPNPPLPTTPAPVVPIPLPPTPTQPSSAFSPIPQSNGSKKGLMIGVIGAVIAVVVLIAGFFAITLLFGNAAKAKKASSSFMTNITAGDSQKALSYINTPDASDKKFIETSAIAVKGSYSFKESTLKGDKFYALYTLSGSKNKYARTELTKTGGSWYVNGFYYSETPLALVATTSAQQDKESAAPVTQVAGACLEQADYRWMEYNKAQSSVTFDSTYNPGKYTNNKTADMFFKPDSTNEDSLPSIYNDWAEFATKNQDKQWKFRLEGSTYGKDATSVASKKLASARAEKVKAELIKRGVQADRFVIDAPHDYGTETQNDKSDAIYRRVQVVIDPTCTTTAQTTTGR